MANNYYELLGVAHGATPAIVKIAYEGQLRALAKSDLAEEERKEAERERQRQEDRDRRQADEDRRKEAEKRAQSR